jgi:PHS family inorganic phosphate transporter-like MFS transporter
MVAVGTVYGINRAYDNAKRQGLIFILFGSVAAFGAIFSWAYLPDPQRWVREGDKWYLETKNLEELGEGRERARQGGEVITLKEKLADIKRKREMARLRDDSPI